MSKDKKYLDLDEKKLIENIILKSGVLSKYGNDVVDYEIPKSEIDKLILYAIKEIKQRIKEVVEGLLKEIDKAIGYYTIQNALNESTFRNERIEGLKIAKELIRKYFPEVVKENE